MYLKPLLGVHLSFEELRAYSPHHLFSIKQHAPLLTPEEIQHISELEDELDESEDQGDDEMDTSMQMDKSSGMMQDDDEDEDFNIGEVHGDNAAARDTNTVTCMMSDDDDDEPHTLDDASTTLQHSTATKLPQLDTATTNEAPQNLAPFMSLDDAHQQLHQPSARLSFFNTGGDGDNTSHSNLSVAQQPIVSAPSSQQHQSHVALMQNIRASLPPDAASRFSFPGDATLHTREAMLDIGSMFQGPLDDEFDNYFEQKKEQRQIKKQVINAQSSQQRMPLQTLNHHSHQQQQNINNTTSDDISLNLSQTFTQANAFGAGTSNPFGGGSTANLSFNIREDTQDISKLNPHSQLSTSAASRRLSLNQQESTAQQRRSSLAPPTSSSQPYHHSTQLDFGSKPRRFSAMPASRSKKVSFGGDSTLSGIGERIKAEATHHRKSIASSMNILSKQSIDSVAPMLAQLFRSTRISPDEPLGYNTQIYHLLWKYHNQQKSEEASLQVLTEMTMPDLDALKSKIGKVSPIQIAEKEVIVNYCRENTNSSGNTDSAVFELDDAQEGLCWIKAQALSRCLWEFYIMKQLQQRIVKEDIRQCFLQPQRMFALTNAPNSLGYLLTNAPQSYPLSTFVECYQYNQQQMPEHLVMYFTVELLKVLGKLHSLGFAANASFAAEHLFLRLQHTKHVQVQWTASGFPQCGILLTNFADFIDFSLFLHSGAATLDHVSLCHLIHLLLTNEPMPQDNSTVTGFRYKPFKAHMYQNELWKEFFDTLLLVDGSEPQLSDLSQSTKEVGRLRKLFEEYLETNKKDKIYKALVNANGRVKRWVSEKRRRV